MQCTNGHMNSFDSKFCLDCGIELIDFELSGLKWYELLGNRIIFTETKLYGSGKLGVLYSDDSGIHFETKKGKWTYAWPDIDSLEVVVASDIVFSTPKSYFGILFRGSSATENYRGQFPDNSMLLVSEKIAEQNVSNYEDSIEEPLVFTAGVTNPNDLASSLEKLSLLYEKDMLSEQEFLIAKRKLLE